MAENDDEMIFTFSTALHKRKMNVDGNDKVVEKARYVDVDPMHIHVKGGDKIVFKALDGDLTVINWPDGQFIVPDGDSRTVTVPSTLSGRLQLRLSINGEDPRGRPTDEDPDLIFDNHRP